MQIPRPVKNLIESFERLPGIGPKTAQRLTFYLLHVPQEMLEEFASALINLKKSTVICSICANISETDPCHICSSQNRNHGLICVVEQPLDILAFERGGRFKGVYHVLHGAISPLNNIGPDEIKIEELLKRVRRSPEEIKEIILATNSNMEGEATAMYIAKELRELKTCRPGDGRPLDEKVKITRLAHGLPIGGDVEYADEMTLQRALEGRREYGA